MKKLIIFLLLTTLLPTAEAQTRRFSASATLGTGISMSKPGSTPFTALITGYYNISPRFSAGIGTGVACYGKALIPLFGELRFLLTRPRKFTPFVAGSAGYAFAPAGDANGGLYLNPSVGVQYALCGHTKLLLSVGYQIQKLERLKSYDSRWFSAQFCEKLQHNSISIQAGVLF